jgi:hypothetical protein
MRKPLIVIAFLLAAAEITIAAEAKWGCDLIVGEWRWFTGGIASIRPDGTVVYPGNDGTWECTDDLFSIIVIRWRIGGYVNKMGLSIDMKELKSLDPTQPYVKATRIPESVPPGPAPPSDDAPPSTEPPVPLPNSPESATTRYILSPKDQQELSRLIKRMSGDFTYTKQIHWPDGSVNDDGYVIATMSLQVDPNFHLVQQYLKCNVTNPGWRTDGYVFSESTPQHCDKNLHNLKWQEIKETAPAAKIDPDSIRVEEIETSQRGSNYAISFAYFGYDRDKPFQVDEPEEDEEDVITIIKAPPGFTILRCRNRGTCGQMASDLKSLVLLARKYAPSPE